MESSSVHSFLSSSTAFLNVGITVDNYLSLTCYFSISHLVVLSHIPFINNITVVSLNWITATASMFHTQSTPFKQALNLQYRAVLRGCLCARICRHYPWTESLSASESFQPHHYQPGIQWWPPHHMAHATHWSRADVAAQMPSHVERKALRMFLLSGCRCRLLVQ